jgi:hypothetical protein
MRWKELIVFTFVISAVVHSLTLKPFSVSDFVIRGKNRCRRSERINLIQSVNRFISLRALRGGRDITLSLCPEESSQPSGTSSRKLRCALFAWESLHTVAEGGVAPHVTELAAGLERFAHSP